MQKLLERRVGADVWSLWTALRIHVSLTKPLRMITYDNRSCRIIAFNALLTPQHLWSEGARIAAAIAVGDNMKVYSTIDAVVFHPEDEEGREVVDDDGEAIYGQKAYEVDPHRYVAVNVDMIASVMADPEWIVIVAAKNDEIVASYAQKDGSPMCDSMTDEYLLASAIRDDAVDRNAEPSELAAIRDELHRQIDDLAAGSDPASSAADLYRGLHRAIDETFDPKAHPTPVALGFAPHGTP